jgi:hypothetical protein
MAETVETTTSSTVSTVERYDLQTRFDMDAIFSNWQLLAAVGWRGYQAQGCGAVVVTVAGEAAGIAYAGGTPSATYARFVEGYDPLEQIVVVVRHETGEHAYVLKGWPSPRECCEAPPADRMSTLYCAPEHSWQQ